MIDHKRQPNGRERECPPVTENPADQPKAPRGDCTAPTPPEPPDLLPPAPCPPTDCWCPPGPGSTANCLEDLIAQQEVEIAGADKALAFKKDLEGLLKAAKDASQKYTRTKYDELTKEWDRQDVLIADLVKTLVCKLDCWRCVIDCYICPKINDIIDARQRLYGDGSLYPDVHNLYDLQYWHTRNRDARQWTLDRVKGVLAAWGDPATTIGKVLAANATAIGEINKIIGSEPGKAVYDIFLKLIPAHLAIAPPKGSKWQTRIDKTYTQFCECDKGTPDDCCGPDVGEGTVRQRILGPQPYLIDPNVYFDLICCLVQTRYVPAKEALQQAAADLLKVENLIKRYKAQLDGVKDFDKNVRPSVPGAIDCCDFDRPETEPTSPTQAR